MKIDCNCPDYHDFEETFFYFNGIKYLEKKCKFCGYMVTEPEHGLKEDIYDLGHYQVRDLVFIPMLINLLDYFYFLSILMHNGLTRKSIFLDFGAGKGFLLLFLNLLGYKNLFGVETSRPRAEFSRNLTGLNISNDYYYGGAIMNRKYDFITLIHVLEHIPEPFIFLDNLIDGACESDGCVFIEVPNINSFSSNIAGRRWAHFTPHFHTNHFTIASFKEYCVDRGLRFSVVSVFSFYHSAMGMTSAILSIFGYRGSIYEDLKSKNPKIILSFLVFLPTSIFLECLSSLFTKKGSVIKLIIYK